MDAALSLAKSLGWTFERLKQDAAPRNDGSDLDEQMLKNLDRITGASEAVRNTVTHWAKEGVEPGTQVISAVVSMLTTGTDVLKAGRVLSTANRNDIEAVVELLQGVLARDDASRQTDDDGDGKRLVEIVGGKAVPPRRVSLAIDDDAQNTVDIIGG
jgi:hypothetical protein